MPKPASMLLNIPSPFVLPERSALLALHLTRSGGKSGGLPRRGSAVDEVSCKEDAAAIDAVWGTVWQGRISREREVGRSYK